MSEDQSDFIPGRSCIDNLFSLQQLLEKKIATGQEVHLAFIDLEKTHDSVPQNKFWGALTRTNLSKPLQSMLKELYRENISYVKSGKQISRPIVVTKGLRQGCSLSPVLFNLHLEVVLQEWKRSCTGMGIPINEKPLFQLNFADDQVLLAQDSYDVEFMLKRLYNEFKKWGLQVSLKKTEYLVVNTDAQFEVLLNDEVHIQQVQEFKYLEAIVGNWGKGNQT